MKNLLWLFLFLIPLSGKCENLSVITCSNAKYSQGDALIDLNKRLTQKTHTGSIFGENFILDYYTKSDSEYVYDDGDDSLFCKQVKIIGQVFMLPISTNLVKACVSVECVDVQK